MITKFTKIPANDPIGRRWPLFFHAGTDWLMTWQMLVELRKDINNAGWVPSPFYVDSHIVHFCLELFTKSLIDYSVSGFNPREFSHQTSKYIKKYQAISPIFARVAKDPGVFDLIREYEKTIDTRFGETYVDTNKDDVEKMILLSYELREEICKKTGLH